VPADPVAALEAVDGEAFVEQHLECSESGGTGSDDAVATHAHAGNMERTSASGQPQLTTPAVGFSDVTLQQLAFFVAAAEHGSFTAAADVLHLARPSVSEQIANLEAELGVALFVRAGRRLQLTDAGRLLRPEAERTLAAAAEASEVVRSARALRGGTASLGTFSTAHHLLLPALVEAFVRRHPQVAVRVVGDNSAQLAHAVRAGRLEAGLVALPIDDEGLEVSAAVAELEVVYATAQPERFEGPVAISRLAERRLVLPEARWGDEDPTRRQLAERAQRAGVAVRPRIEVQDAGASLELAALGLGDTLVTAALLRVLGYEDRLSTRPLDPPLHETFAFVQRRNARLSPATRALMTLAEEHLAALTVGEA
jgi:DNA-binding transcriptional LysR family regulator